MRTTLPHITFSLESRDRAWLAVLFAAMLSVTAAPVALTNAEPVTAATNLMQTAPRSVFTQPSNPKEGCDPFFPYSVRPYATAVAPSGPVTDLSSVTMNGISGSTEHRLVIINNVTFAVGDEAEVFTSQGRIRIHCLLITDDSAMIEAAGQRQVLHYKSK
jgi:hypothetical protein